MAPGTRRTARVMQGRCNALASRAPAGGGGEGGREEEEREEADTDVERGEKGREGESGREMDVEEKRVARERGVGDGEKDTREGECYIKKSVWEMLG